MNENLINFYSENDFTLQNELSHSKWLKDVVASEDHKVGEINFVFCDDEYLAELNKKYLDHDTYTDIISFDNSLGKILNGDIFISTERVSENAHEYQVPFEEELRRVLVHGILHFCRYSDKTTDEELQMRQKEEEKMKMFHVEQ